MPQRPPPDPLAPASICGRGATCWRARLSPWYLRLFAPRSFGLPRSGAIVPLVARCRSDSPAWPTRGTVAVAGIENENVHGESEANRRLRRPRWSASCDGKVGGAHPGTRAARGLSEAATSEREASRYANHGDTRARQPEARRPPMKAFASTGPEGVAAGALGGRFAVGRSERPSERPERSEPSSLAGLVWRASPAAAPSGPVANAGPRPATAQPPQAQRAVNGDGGPQRGPRLLFAQPTVTGSGLWISTTSPPSPAPTSIVEPSLASPPMRARPMRVSSWRWR